MASYKIGTDDPPLGHDPGAGPWNSKSKELTMIALKFEIQQHLTEAAVVVGLDASRNMAHYLGNSGSTLTIRLQNMVDTVPSAKTLYEQELEEAKSFAQSLADGAHDITSRELSHGYNYQHENRNWYFAIGGYSAWGKGSANVSTGGGTRNFSLEFEYKFYDRYNWDAGKSVTLFGIKITDKFMGEFHRQGLAQEFDCVGSIKHTYTWTVAAAVPPPPPPTHSPSPTPKPAKTTYVVKPGDSLWKIAEKVYGDGNQWHKIYQANKGVIGPNPNLIHSGQVLTIP